MPFNSNFIDYEEPYDNIDPVSGELENLTWTDARGQRVVFSAGEDEMDPLAQSLACALRLAEVSNTWQGDDEPPLHDEYEVGEDNNDPFHCSGKLVSAVVK
jgi:hypothetical protein